MKKRFFSKLAVLIMMVAVFMGGVSLQHTIPTKATITDFDCEYGVNDLSDPFISNGYGTKNVVTYTEAEAAAAGVPAGFSGDVVSVLHTQTNRGIMLDFSSKKIPAQLVKSITFRVYIGDDGNPTDGYPELRIPEPYSNGGWVMRYPFASKTDAWQEVVLQDGNNSFFNNGARTANFNMLEKDGCLYKFELSMRHNGSNATFYIDSVKLGLIEDKTAPVLTYHGEDVVTIAKGQELNFSVEAVDALEGAVDVEYVWGDPAKLENGLPLVGTHTLTFVARDFFGNTAEKTITVIVEEPDVTPPTLVVPVDTIYAKIGARNLLEFAASDDRGAVKVSTVWSDGALDRRERLMQGTHTLTITATDLSGNQTQAIITFIVTKEGDTADVIIDEEILCPDPIEPDLSDDSSSSEEPEVSDDSSSSEVPDSSDDSSSSEEPEVSDDSSSSETPDSSDDSSTSEMPDSSDDSSTSEIPDSSDDPSSGEESVGGNDSGENESGSNPQEDEGNGEGATKTGCGGVIGMMSLLPIAFAGCLIICKRKEDAEK